MYIWWGYKKYSNVPPPLVLIFSNYFLIILSIHYFQTMLFEMNRIGMLVEISHLSEAGMIAALKTAKAPVLMMNAAPASFCNSTNVASIPDRVLRLVLSLLPKG